MYHLKRLKQIRLQKNLSQQIIARALNITRQQYGLYETGKRELPLHHLKTLAQYYDITTDYILEIEKTKEEPQNEPKKNLQEAAAESH